ncbi:DNA replication protein [Lacticaseibacillus camelliae DSM 22697 = JCM 13995]|uniref:DNA replication protein n=2 Tax=Lacticaseibacillus camelliae TaxID=381742 RepID=A0A0R2FJP3_9LACO|nr:DNA replication protein [Lacticaseibacillus camelliae DSM 22697 = JCM 13995]
MKDELAKIMDRRQLTSEYRKMVQDAVADPDVQTFLSANQGKLASDAVVRGAAKIYEFVTARDRLAAGDPLIAPGYQPQLVVSNGLIDITYVATPEKIAQDALAAKSRLITALNMPKAIKNADIDTYDEKDRGQALSAALDFTTGMAEAPDDFHKGLYLTGPFGVGKTFLLGAIANDLAKHGIASTLLHYPTFAVEMKDAITDNSVLAKTDGIKKAKVLMIDDIGAEAWSAWVRDEVLAVILQYRMQEELPTLFTSNKNMQELTAFLSGSETGKADEPVKAQRIMERVRFLAKEITVGGPDRRNV